MNAASNRRFIQSNLIALTGFTALFAVLAAVAVMFHSCGYLFNVTNSVPIGLYRITSNPSAPFVTVCPTGIAERLTTQRNYRPVGHGCGDGYIPMLKPVAARPGDSVRDTGWFLYVNGHRLPNTQTFQYDGHHRPLPQLPHGIYTVKPGTVWLISTYNDYSFDSRYFGAVSDKEIRHHVRPVWLF